MEVLFPEMGRWEQDRKSWSGGGAPLMFRGRGGGTECVCVLGGGGPQPHVGPQRKTQDQRGLPNPGCPCLQGHGLALGLGFGGDLCWQCPSHAPAESSECPISDTESTCPEVCHSHQQAWGIPCTPLPQRYGRVLTSGGWTFEGDPPFWVARDGPVLVLTGRPLRLGKLPRPR